MYISRQITHTVQLTFLRDAFNKKKMANKIEFEMMKKSRHNPKTIRFFIYIHKKPVFKACKIHYFSIFCSLFNLLFLFKSSKSFKNFCKSFNFLHFYRKIHFFMLKIECFFYLRMCENDAIMILCVY